MARLNLAAIALLAVATSPEDSDSPITNENVAAAMKLARERKAEKALEATAETLEDALNRIDTVKVAAKRSIRKYREAIKREVATMDKIDLALAYGNETSNFIPLMVALNMGYSSHDFGITSNEYDRLSKVPKDWKPQAAE